jgi:hypothetical protein
VDLRQALRTNDGQQIDQKLIAALEDDIDSLDAVMQCGLAQERIANDVLSLSRIQLQVRLPHSPTIMEYSTSVTNNYVFASQGSGYSPHRVCTRR